VKVKVPVLVMAAVRLLFISNMRGTGVVSREGMGDEESGWKDEKEKRGEGKGMYVLASRMPGFKLTSGPSRKRRETVPAVVGTQLRVVGTPTLMLRPPSGMLKGFWALARAASAHVKRVIVKRILIGMMGLWLG